MTKFNPTPEQIDVFRRAEEEAEYGNPLFDADITGAQFDAAIELAGMGYLEACETPHGYEFEITAEGQAAFADCGR